MKITDKILSIPPYLSTSWEKVSSLHMSELGLVVMLKDGTSVIIPHLQAEVVEQIFSAHVTFLEQETKILKQSPQKGAAAPEAMMQAPMKQIFGTIEALSQVLQHNPAHSDLGPVTSEIAEKIGELAKIISPEDIDAMPPAVENCNCLYCQTRRLLQKYIEPSEQIPTVEEEKVTDADLHFEQWIIEQEGNKLYTVINKLDTTEQYRVFLGEPIGCTCGRANCEHIIAVLRH